jgi:hypothetical protein
VPVGGAMRYCNYMHDPQFTVILIKNGGAGDRL